MLTWEPAAQICAVHARRSGDLPKGEEGEEKMAGWEVEQAYGRLAKRMPDLSTKCEAWEVEGQQLRRKREEEAANASIKITRGAGDVG